MALTRIQQSQISGSLSSAINDSLDAGSSLAGQLTLKDDLNALRSQMKRVIGKDAWYSELDGSQDLADIYAAMRVTGAATTFQGDITVGGNNIKSSGGDVALTLDDAAVSVAGDLMVGGNNIKSSGGDVALTLDDADVSVAGDLMVGGNDIKSSGGAVALTLDDADVSVAGDLTVGGNDIRSSGGTVALTLADADVSVAGDLMVGGNNIKSSGGTVALTLADANVSVAGALNVGDSLSVAGASLLNSLAVTGSSGLAVAGASALAGGLTTTTLAASSNAYVGGALTVNGSSTSYMNNLTVSGSAGIQTTTLAASSHAGVNGMLVVNGTMTVNGSSTSRMNNLTVSGSAGIQTTTLAASSDAGVNGALVVNGATTLSSTLNAGASTLSSLLVTGNAQVQGDLLVQGSFTYIETDNMKVKDAFIYLATGSNGSVDSGIVLSKGAGSSWDLVVGQDGGAGEIIFAQVAHNADGTSPADLDGSSLVPAWLSNVKLGSVEGSLNGSLAASAAGIELTSPAGKDIAIAATSALSLASNGNAAINFADAEQAPSGFTATTIVGMLNELRSAASGGSLAKASYTSSNFADNVLTFSGQGTLAAAQHKFIDVYLNGVLMAPDGDLTALSTTAVTFDASIVNALTSDDVIVVITRG